MATEYNNPKIVIDNLLLYLDAGNTKSYPGTGTDWYDLTNNKFHMNLINGPTFSTVSGVKCFSLDGSNDKGVCDGTISGSVEATVANLGLTTTNPKTVVCWVNKNANAPGNDDGTIFDLGDSGSNGREFALRGWGSPWTSWRAQFWGDADYDFTYDTIDKWTMFSVVYGIDRIGKTYANDTLAGEDSSSYDLTTGGSTPFTMGKWDYGTNWWGGRVAMFMVYNKGLTAAEVKQNFDAHKGRFGL